MVSFLNLVLGGMRVMLLIRATGCLFESLEYILPVPTHPIRNRQVWRLPNKSNFDCRLHASCSKKIHNRINPRGRYILNYESVLWLRNRMLFVFIIESRVLPGFGFLSFLKFWLSLSGKSTMTPKPATRCTPVTGFTPFWTCTIRCADEQWLHNTFSRFSMYTRLFFNIGHRQN